MFLILLLTVLVYWPLFQNGFLSTWDDNRYILDNQYIQHLDFKSITRMFGVYFDGHYHPLTLLSLTLDYQIDGFNPKVFHTTNLLFHLLNTLLVFRFVNFLLKRKNRNVALVTALLFGIATIHVESVAWATERKNVLFAFFYLLSLNVWLSYLSGKKRWSYFLAILFFVLALLSKSMALPLVFSLIAIDYYHQRKWFGKKELLEKLPFFALAILFGLVAIWAQKSTWGEGLSQESIGFGERIFYASYAFVAYAVKIFFPFGLSGLYPYPHLSGKFFLLSSGAILMIITLVTLVFRKFKKGGMARFGFLFFLINIFLLLKLFDVPAGDYIMADRYAYVASIGGLLVFAWYANRLMERGIWWERGGIGLLVIYVLFVSLNTFKQVSTWQSDEEFYTQVIQQCPDAEIAYLNRGGIFQKQGRMKLAEADYSAAIKLNPKQYKNYANRGIVYNATAQYSKATSDLEKAAQLSGNRLEILTNLGFALMQSGQAEKALQQFNRVLQIQPDNAEVLTNRGTLKYNSDHLEDAISDYNKALHYQPKYLNAIYNRGLAYLNLGNSEAALNDFKATVSLDPSHVGAYSNMGVAYSQLGKTADAFDAYGKAIDLQPGNFEAYLNRGVDHFYQHEFNEALEDFDACLKVNKAIAAAYYFKGLTLINLGQDGGCANLKIAADKGFEMAGQMLKNYCK